MRHATESDLNPGSVPEAPPKSERVKGARYWVPKRGDSPRYVGIWTGSQWNCEHGRRRKQCKPCGGSLVCEHNRQRSYCKFCGGSQICEHGRRRYRCKPCGGSQICKHGRERSICKSCGGSQICEHGRDRNTCHQCEPFTAFASVVRSAVRMAFRRGSAAKSKRTEEYLTIPLSDFRAYIEAQFEPGMTFENHGEWHLDHRKPVASFDQSDPDAARQCNHFTNFQPMWGPENKNKHDTHDSETFRYFWDDEAGWLGIVPPGGD